DVNFIAAGGARFGLDFSSDDDAGFLRESLQSFEGLRLVFERHHALDDSCTVTKNREQKLAGFAEIVEPAADRDCLPGILASLFYRDNWLGVGSVGLRLLGHSVVRFIGLSNKDLVVRSRLVSRFFSSLSNVARI